MYGIALIPTFTGYCPASRKQPGILPTNKGYLLFKSIADDSLVRTVVMVKHSTEQTHSVPFSDTKRLPFRTTFRFYKYADFSVVCQLAALPYAAHLWSFSVAPQPTVLPYTAYLSDFYGVSAPKQIYLSCYYYYMKQYFLCQGKFIPNYSRQYNPDKIILFP